MCRCCGARLTFSTTDIAILVKQCPQPQNAEHDVQYDTNEIDKVEDDGCCIDSLRPCSRCQIVCPATAGATTMLDMGRYNNSHTHEARSSHVVPSSMPRCPAAQCRDSQTGEDA
eukprot:TRINITY_DN20192_c0_g1_i2.p2 TRINITY_DN20192_c0_g1~~TRINITY_DN20192_c0_g1_i2.p2  ORF type:complete len:114 (-),score=6.14 TRINITY_DN20192_c0_g1_i2:231-572(-)